jgi:hypothetical protein
MMLLVLLLGCPKPSAPVVFSDAFPRLEDSPAPEFGDMDDSCPSARAFVPDKPAPYVVDDYATCRGTVVRESYVLTCTHRRDELDASRKALTTCYDGRDMDRAHAQDTVNRLHAYQVDLERDNRALRYAGPALFVGGVIVGAAVGVAASQVDQAILP